MSASFGRVGATKTWHRFTRHVYWPNPGQGWKITWHRIGCANRPFYLIGACPNKYRVGKLPDEIIGAYDPMPNERGEKLCSIDFDRLAFYLGKGAKCTHGIAYLLGFAGYFPHHPRVYMQAWRNRQTGAQPTGIR